jgi:hypothetical protein
MASYLPWQRARAVARRTSAGSHRQIVTLLKPVLCDREGNWTADYVRLRFVARRRRKVGPRATGCKAAWFPRPPSPSPFARRKSEGRFLTPSGVSRGFLHFPQERRLPVAACRAPGRRRARPLRAGRDRCCWSALSSPMLLHDPLADPEAQAGALLSLGGEEGLEELGLIAL